MQLKILSRYLSPTFLVASLFFLSKMENIGRRRSGPAHVMSVAHMFLDLKSFDRRFGGQSAWEQDGRRPMSIMIEFLVRGTLTNMQT